MTSLPEARRGTVAITMAGHGSRFVQAGYRQPKYEIEVHGVPLFDWSMHALEAFRVAGWQFRFAARAHVEAAHYVDARCRALGITNGGVIELEQVTDGQATTALMLAELADPIEPFLVFNIDTYVRPNAMAPELIPPDADGWVPCFPGPGDGWSFVAADSRGRATELREKKRISPNATVGLYWFSSAALYRDTYKAFFKAGGEEKGERYIAPMYNHLIGAGRSVRIEVLPLEAVGMLGTPEQVQAFSADTSRAGYRPGQP